MYAEITGALSENVGNDEQGSPKGPHTKIMFNIRPSKCQKITEK